MHAMSDDVDEFRECGGCICFRLRRAARMITQHYDHHLRPAGLRATQFTLLATLAQTGPMPMQRLASHLGLERTTLTRNLQPLAAKRLVRVEQDEDRRVRSVGITTKGKDVARSALPAWRKAQSSAVRKFGELRLGGLIASARAE